MIILIISIDFVECLYWSFLEQNKDLHHKWPRIFENIWTLGSRPILFKMAAEKGKNLPDLQEAEAFFKRNTLTEEKEEIILVLKDLMET